VRQPDGAPAGARSSPPFRAPAPLVRPLSYPIGALAVEWRRSPPVHRRSRPRRCLGSCRRHATRGQAEEIEKARGLLTRRTQTRTLAVGRLARRPPPRRAGARTQDRHRGAGSLTSPSSRASRCATCAGSEAGGATSRLTRPAPRSGDRRVCPRDPSSRSAAGARRTGASKVTKPSYHRPVSAAWHAVEPLLHAPEAVGDCWHATVVRADPLLGHEIVPGSLPLLVQLGTPVRPARGSPSCLEAAALLGDRPGSSSVGRDVRCRSPNAPRSLVPRQTAGPARCRRIVGTTSRRGGSEPSISRAGHPRMAAAAHRA
jgi:hypothetical protein